MTSDPPSPPPHTHHHHHFRTIQQEFAPLLEGSQERAKLATKKCDGHQVDLVKVNEINRELSEEIDALERTVEGLEIKKMRVEEARRAEEEHKDGAKQQLLGVKLEVRRLWEQSGAQTADVGSFLAQIVLNCDADENVVRMYVAGKKVGRSRRRCAHRMGV